MRRTRPTQVPRARMVRHDPTATHTLLQPMWLEDTRRATRYALVAGNATGGLLRPFGDLDGPLPGIGQRLTLLGGRTSPVRFVVQVDDVLLKRGERVISVRWVLLTASDESRELRTILRDVLKVNLSEHDVPGDGATGRNRLVYQAERKTLRTLSTAVPSV